MIRARAVAKSYGSRTLFEGVELQVQPGDRVGLVGPNGAGKTTLLRMLAGVEPCDDGQVVTERGVRVGYLQQEVDPSSQRPVIEEVRTALDGVRRLEAEMESLEERIAERGRAGEEIPPDLSERYARLRSEYERAGGYRAESDLRETLMGLGLGPERWDQPLRRLSGGWLMRVELAKLLLRRPDVLLLDEPTNHLDLPSIGWFEGMLRDFPGAAIVVSHDRTFLDRHATSIVELEAARATSYRGNYAAYLEQKQLRRAEAEGRVRNLDRRIAHATRFVERFGVKATKARQAQSRKKLLERLEEERERQAPTATRRLGRAMKLRFPKAPRSGDVVLRFEALARSYGDLCIYDSLDLEIRRGERIALVGPNGAGKSTLLRLAAGALEPDGGSRELGHNVRVAFYAQHQLDALAAERTVLGEIEAGAQLDDVPRLRSLLGAFLFSGDDVEKRVSVLSGGEKARLALAKLLLRRANFLVLDEPTNHLDMRAREVLTEALQGFDGTLLFISHDRTLINALANRVLEVTRSGPASQVRSFPGNYDDYLRRLDADARPRSSSESPDAHAQRQPADAGPKSDARSEPAGPPAGGPAAAPRRRSRRTYTLRRLQERCEQVETSIAEAESQIERLDWLSADPAIARDGERMRELAAERAALEERREALYREWEDVAAEIEAVEDGEGPGATGA
jgi:ATP-binding cassette subfamily F protein 3